MPIGVRQQPKSGYGAHPCDRRLRQRGVAVRQFGGIDYRCHLIQIDSRTNRMNLTIAFPCDNRLPVRPALMGKGVFRVRDSEFFLCHDTDHSLVASVSRQSSGPKLRFPSRDTDRCAALSVPRRHCQAVHIVVVTKQHVIWAWPADQLYGHGWPTKSPFGLPVSTRFWR